MTVTAAETRIEYAGNGTTKVFAYPYQFYQNSDLEVWLFNDTTGEGVHQIVGQDYTVTGAMNVTGGSLTFTVAPPAGYTLIIINDPDIVQATHYVNADDFPADSHEAALDRLTKICQRLSDRIDRAVKAPDYAPEDQVPDADTLVNLVNDAQEAAAEAEAAASNAQNSQAQAGTSASTASDAANAASASANQASISAASALGSANSATNSATQAANSAAAAQVAEVEWRGNWSASTPYFMHDAVFFSGSSYISLQDNQNSQPDSHPTIWGLLAQQGAPGTAGSGAGDMLRANNLNDVLDPTASRTNLGLGTSATKDIGTTTGHVPDAATVLPLNGSAPMTGDLTITKANPAFNLNKTAANQTCVLRGELNGSRLWALEMGSSDGPQSLDLTCYDDSGNLLFYALQGVRATGLLSVQADPTAPLGVATKQYVDGKAPAAATAAEYIANSAPGKMLTPGAAWGAGPFFSLADAATVTPDMSLGVNFYWAIGGVNRTLANPTGGKAGQSGIIMIAQNATGGRTITGWGSQFLFAGGVKPVLSTAPNTFDIISYFFTGGAYFCTFNSGFA